MATLETLPLSRTKRLLLVRRRDGMLLSIALTVAALLIHGYHPYAEDGGLYLTGIEKILQPNLFPSWTDFVSVHMRWSFFAPAMALLVRLTHIDLMIATFAVYVLSIWATLYGAWELVRVCECSRKACIGAITTLALALTIPVAGTSLMLMDPYLTGRSISTPCGLFALVAAVGMRRELVEANRPGRKNAALFIGALFLAAAAHPLMAAYAFGGVLFFCCFAIGPPKMQWRLATGLWVLTITLGALIQWTAPPQSAAYIYAARTRLYWFLSQWSWYELLGLLGPVAVLWMVWAWGERERNARSALACMALAMAATAVTVALLFAHSSSTNDSVARLQPLRAYQPIYLLMLLAIGGFVAERFLQRNFWRWVAFVLALGGGMFSLQRTVYSNSPHIEAPWSKADNAWEKAFFWIRQNTPLDAVFALDSHYTNAPGEDTQNFRAIAQRSALPDYPKDGGAAAIAPDLAAEWQQGASLQIALKKEIDEGSIEELRKAGVNWVLVQRAARTDLDCPYVNERVKVCRLADH